MKKPHLKLTLSGAVLVLDWREAPAAVAVDWHPEDVKAALGKKGVSLRQLAKQHGRRVPIFVKIAPDLDADQVGAIAATLKRHAIDGVVATNTTIARDAVKGMAHADEAGGLSGKPVFDASNRVIAQLRKALGKAYPIIGVGGVMSGADAKAKVDAGADVVQVYTGFIYRGPELVSEAAKALAAARA